MTAGAPDLSRIRLSRIRWARAWRIVRSRFPPIGLFEDIADPADWDAIAAAEAKTNPRLAEAVGALDLVPTARRVAGEGASWVMAPFVHVSPDRPSRFADGTFGAYHAGSRFEVALFETIHHHQRFMAATGQAPGWTSEFRELVGPVDARLHDIRDDAAHADCIDPDSHGASQALARLLRRAGSDGIVWRSVRWPRGDCIAAFWPDVVGIPAQGRHLAYHWDGARVNLVRELPNGAVHEVVPG